VVTELNFGSPVTAWLPNWGRVRSAADTALTAGPLLARGPRVAHPWTKVTSFVLFREQNDVSNLVDLVVAKLSLLLYWCHVFFCTANWHPKVCRVWQGSCNVSVNQLQPLLAESCTASHCLQKVSSSKHNIKNIYSAFWEIHTCTAVFKLMSAPLHSNAAWQPSSLATDRKTFDSFSGSSELLSTQ